ncbi:MAG: hypothetical protein ABIT10_05000 [Alteraurantiacibacter sp.]
MFAILMMLAAANAAPADIRPLLRDQGFPGPLNGRELITFVGTVHQGVKDYQVYTFEGVHRAAVVDHGVGGIIVILNGSTYLGQYRMSSPTGCNIRGQRVVCQTSSPGSVIQFTRQGPPRQTWLDGEVLQFEFGNWINRARRRRRAHAADGVPEG